MCIQTIDNPDTLKAAISNDVASKHGAMLLLGDQLRMMSDERAVSTSTAHVADQTTSSKRSVR